MEDRKKKVKREIKRKDEESAGLVLFCFFSCALLFISPTPGGRLVSLKWSKEGKHVRSPRRSFGPSKDKTSVDGAAAGEGE